MNTKILLIGCLLLIAIAATATVPNDWIINTNYVVPPCNTQTNVKHFEVAVDASDQTGLVGTYDAFKTRGYVNLQYRILSNGDGVWSGDCTLAN